VLDHFGLLVFLNVFGVLPIAVCLIEQHAKHLHRAKELLRHNFVVLYFSDC